MLSRLHQGVDFQGTALVMRAQRHQLLANNIANADTPGFIAKDVNFAQALSLASGQLKSQSNLAITAPNHLGANTPAWSQAYAQHLTYAAPSQTNLDGNTVDMDRERANFVDNSVKYEASLRFINSNVRTMLEAIKGS